LEAGGPAEFVMARPRRPISTSQVVGETTNPINVRMLEAIAAQKPDALNPEILRIMLTNENRTANGRKTRPRVKMPRIAKTEPNKPDIRPALDGVRYTILVRNSGPLGPLISGFASLSACTAVMRA
jgi:hypothetical protein